MHAAARARAARRSRLAPDFRFAARRDRLQGRTTLPITSVMRLVLMLAPIVVCALTATTSDSLASAASDDVPGFIDRAAVERLHALAPQLQRLANGTAGLIAVTVGDLQSGRAIAINGGVNL